MSIHPSLGAFSACLLEGSEIGRQVARPHSDPLNHRFIPSIPRCNIGSVVGRSVIHLVMHCTHGCQMAIAKFLDCGVLALWA